MRKYILSTRYEKKKCYKDGYKVSVGAIIPIGFYWLEYDLVKINMYQIKGIKKKYQNLLTSPLKGV